MNSIQIFRNEQFGQVRIVINANGEPLFCLTDVCQVLDLGNPSQVKSRLSDGVISNEGIADSLGRIQQANFVNEDGLYDVILDSRKSEAKQFRRWITSEVLPSIRKHGAYMTNETLEKALTPPDFLIQLAYQLKEEQQKRIAAEQLVSKQREVISHKSDIIEGLVDDLPLAELRQRITQIVRYGSVNFQKRYQLFYKEFELKYHMSLNRRINSAKVLAIKPEIKNKMDYIDRILGMIPELYDIACKIFETDVKKLIKREWKISSL